MNVIYCLKVIFSEGEVIHCTVSHEKKNTVVWIVTMYYMKSLFASPVTITISAMFIRLIHEWETGSRPLLPSFSPCGVWHTQQWAHQPHLQGAVKLITNLVITLCSVHIFIFWQYYINFLLVAPSWFFFVHTVVTTTITITPTAATWWSM